MQHTEPVKLSAAQNPVKHNRPPDPGPPPHPRQAIVKYPNTPKIAHIDNVRPSVPVHQPVVHEPVHSLPVTPLKPSHIKAAERPQELVRHNTPVLPAAQAAQTSGTLLPLRNKIIAGCTIAVIVGLVIAVRPPLGHIIIAIYGIVAMVKMLPSTLTFKLALGVMVLSVIGFIVAGSQGGVVATLLVSYAVLLMAIGAVSVGLEMSRAAQPKVSV